jgi:hypothetical protein
MRKDDWITKLYYKQLSDKSRYNRNTRKVISSKKEISGTQNQFRKGQRS